MTEGHSGNDGLFVGNRKTEIANRVFGLFPVRDALFTPKTRITYSFMDVFYIFFISKGKSRWEAAWNNSPHL